MPDRAVVAISEDRQWLVVLDTNQLPLPRWKFFYQRDYTYVQSLRDKQIEDTGQSADEVLAAFLEERNA